MLLRLLCWRRLLVFRVCLKSFFGAPRLVHRFSGEQSAFARMMALRSLFATIRGLTPEQRECCANTWARVVMDEPIGVPRSW